LSSSSKTLSKHIYSAPMFWFCFHSIRGAVGICETACRVILERTFILAWGYRISVRVEPWLVVY
jgi:hypothetical protein